MEESACNSGDMGLIPGSGRSPGEGNGYPLQNSVLENPKDRGTQLATAHAVVKGQTGLSHEHFHFQASWGITNFHAHLAQFSLIISEETEDQSGTQIWVMSPSRDIAEPFGSMLWSRYGRREILHSSVGGAEPMRYPEKSP